MTKERRDCMNCKYEDIDMDKIPCVVCRLVLHNNKWEAKEEGAQL